MENLKTVLENRAQAQIQEESGVKVYPCAEILGSMVTVVDFAKFYESHKTDLELIKASHLMDYVNSQSFTPEVLKGFKMGLEVINFFESSRADAGAYADEQSKKQKSLDD